MQTACRGERAAPEIVYAEQLLVEHDYACGPGMSYKLRTCCCRGVRTAVRQQAQVSASWGPCAPMFEKYHMSTMPQVTGLNQEGHRMLELLQTQVVGLMVLERGVLPR